METCKIEKGFFCKDGEDCEDLVDFDTICGDGLRRGDEECDDGNLNDDDGCDHNCETEDNGVFCTESTMTKCKPICGDGLKRGNEECDDFNTFTDPVTGDEIPVSGDGCNSLCKLERGYLWDSVFDEVITDCGDGIIVFPERCEIAEFDTESAIYCD